MKEWLVIHQIKALHNHGNGLSERQIAQQLWISRNTVSKYLKLPEPVIAALLADTERRKKLNQRGQFRLNQRKSKGSVSIDFLTHSNRNQV
jgi:predicted transcriptional regulator